MQIRRSYIFICGVLIFVVGTVIGSWLTGTYVMRHKDRFCEQRPVGQSAMAADKAATVALTPGRLFGGQVSAKSDGQIKLMVKVYGTSVAQTEITIPVSSADIIVQLQRQPGTSDLKTIVKSFADIKEGDQLMIKVLSDKKLIYLPLQ